MTQPVEMVEEAGDGTGDAVDARLERIGEDDDPHDNRAGPTGSTADTRASQQRTRRQLLSHHLEEGAAAIDNIFGERPSR